MPVASRIAEMFNSRELFGVVLTLPREPEEHVARLMRTLGVPIEVVPVTVVAINGLSRCPRVGCDWTYGGTAVRAEKFLERHLATAHAVGGAVSRVQVLHVEEPAKAVSRRLPVAEVAAKKRPGGRRQKWTREAIVAAFHEYAATHNGLAPVTTEWQLADPSRPSYSNVQYVFGSWAAALAAAGLRNRNGKQRNVEVLGRSGVGHSAVTGSADQTRTGEDAEGHAASRRPVRPDVPNEDSSSEGAESQPDPRGPARPGDGGGLDEQQPAMAAPTPEAPVGGSGEQELQPAPEPAANISVNISHRKIAYRGVVAVLLRECTAEQLNDMLVEAVARADRLAGEAECARGEALVLTIALERATELAA